MSERRCDGCGSMLNDHLEVFTWADQALYLCEDCAGKVSDFINSLGEQDTKP